MIGLGLILLWLGGSVRSGFGTLRRLPVGSDRRLLVAGLTAATFSYMLASCFHDLQHDIPDLSIAALITAILVTVCSFPAPEPDAGSAPSTLTEQPPDHRATSLRRPFRPEAHRA